MAIDKLPGTAIATDAITADQLATGSITVADIPTGEITADKLHTTLNLSSKTLTLPNGVISINNISDVNTSGVANGKILKYNGSAWVIADDAGGPADTDALSEGSSNLYFTNARARSAISENSTQLAYNNSTGVLTFIQGNTDTVGEGTSNLYFTNTRADARADLRITNALKDEDNMASNSATHVPSQQSVKAYADTKLALTGGTLTGSLVISSSDLTVGNVGYWGGTQYGKLTWSATNNRAIVRGESGKNLSLGANGTQDYVFIKTDGNVGIGETSPENILHIKTSAAGGPQIELDSTSGTANSAFINFDGTSLQLATQRDMVDGSKRDTAKSWGGINIVGVAAGSYINFQTSEGNNNSVSTKMTITKEGDVGIGATNPGGSRLYVQDTHTTTVTNATQLISNTTLTINGNSSQGSDVMRMGPMGTSGRYFIDVSNSAGSAAYDLLLNPTGGGKVGIGTTSPGFRLHVVGGTRFAGSENATHGQVSVHGTSAGDAQISFVTDANGRAIYVDNDDTNKMKFSTGWGKGVAYKEVVMDNDANLICGGGTKEGRGITLYGSGGNGFYSVTTGTSFYCITNHQSTSSTGTISTFYNNATYCGGISITGTNQTLFQSGSDYRLKENIVDMADGATAILKKLRPRTFNFKSDPGNTIDGFIAHEVEGIVDNAVTGIKDEVYDEAGAEDNPNVDVGDPKYQGIDPGKMVPLLVKTIQELEARITQLESV